MRPAEWGSTSEGKPEPEPNDGVTAYIRSCDWSALGVDASTLTSLAAALRDTGPWEEDPGLPPEVGDSKLWEKTVGNWKIALMDFSIEEQGFPPGSRGQDVVMTNLGGKGLVIASPHGRPQHDLAHWLYKRMVVKYGNGRTQKSDLPGSGGPDEGQQPAV